MVDETSVAAKISDQSSKELGNLRERLYKQEQKELGHERFRQRDDLRKQDDQEYLDWKRHGGRLVMSREYRKFIGGNLDHVQEQDDKVDVLLREGKVSLLSYDRNRYDNRWGEFDLTHEDLSKSENILYSIHSRHFEVLLEKLKPDRGEISPGLFAETACALTQIEHRAFQENNRRGQLSNLDAHSAQTIDSFYVENLVNMISEILSDKQVLEQPDLELYENEDLDLDPRIKTPFLPFSNSVAAVLHEICKEAVQREQTRLATYFDSPVDDNSRLDKMIEKINSFNFESESSQKQHNTNLIDKSNWFFYFTTPRWYVDDQVGVGITSHSPNLEFNSYYKDRNSRDEGLLALPDKVIQAFSGNANSNFLELEEAYNWTPELGADLQLSTSIVRESLRNSGQSEQEFWEKMVKDARKIYCEQDLKKCWDNLPEAEFSEIWVQNVRAYAIWIPEDWEEKYESWCGKLDKPTLGIINLMLNRPDLPIIRTGEEPALVDRQEIYQFVQGLRLQKQK